jgi:ribose transport system permease protein
MSKVAEPVQKIDSGAVVPDAVAEAFSPAGDGPTLLVRIRRSLSFRNCAALYLLALMFLVFSLWIPGTFLLWGTWRSLLSEQAITCLVAVGLIVPIAAGAVDLAVGTEVGLGTVLVAWLMADRGLGIPLAIALSLLAGAGVGVISWVMITRFRIPAFIATLGVSSVLTAVILWVSNSQPILNLPPSFSDIGDNQLLGLSYPFWIMLVIATILWYVLERTPAGRRVYATGGDFGGMGGNSDAAKLAGVRTSRVILFSLITCGVISTLAGVLASSQLATGDPTIGPGYLLPTISAVFLGSTQFRGGRMNVWGTVVAAYVLATGIKGLQLAGGPIWVPDMFDGVALLLAVGLAVWRRTPTARREAIRRMLTQWTIRS